MRCKICKVTLKDIGYPLDVYGSKTWKEELICPYDDKHEKIVEKRIRSEPEECPICGSAYINGELQIYEEKGDLIINLDQECERCRFRWTILAPKSQVQFDEEQLDEYGEWE